MMNKYKLKITHSSISALCQWLETSISSNKESLSYERMTVWILLYKWMNTEQVYNLCRFRFEGEKKLSLKPEIAAALASAINTYPQETTSYLGNYLRIVLDDLHKFFNLKY